MVQEASLYASLRVSKSLWIGGVAGGRGVISQSYCQKGELGLVEIVMEVMSHQESPFSPNYVALFGSLVRDLILCIWNSYPLH